MLTGPPNYSQQLKIFVLIDIHMESFFLYCLHIKNFLPLFNLCGGDTECGLFSGEGGRPIVSLFDRAG